LGLREEIAPTVYYRWSKAFGGAGKNGLIWDANRDAMKVKLLKQDNADLLPLAATLQEAGI